MLLHALAVVDTPLRMQQTERAGHLVEAAEPFVLLLLVPGRGASATVPVSPQFAFGSDFLTPVFPLCITTTILFHISCRY